MWKRMVAMLVVTLAVIGGLGLVKFRQIQTAIAQGAAFQPPPEAVTTVVAQEAEWPATLTAIGTMAAVRGVTVSADLPGTVERILFESGQAVREGQVLAVLDTRQEQAQLARIDAQRELAHLTFERVQGLLNEKVISRAEYDRATADLRTSEAQAGEIRASIQRKTIRAPFSGILGIRQVNLGQYLSGGDAVVPLQALHPIYVNFGVPQQDTARVRVGGTVRVTADELSGTAFAGRVTAVDSVINQATRNVQVQATVPNPNGALRPGMFVQTAIVTGATRSMVSVPASAIGYAPFGDSVYILADLKGPDGKAYRGVRQQFVKIGPTRGDRVAVLSGVNPGDEVVTSGVFKLRNGAPVNVNNTVQPGNNLSPTLGDS
jgi:membrane fusion protein (multidrug efflux system)